MLKVVINSFVVDSILSLVLSEAHVEDEQPELMSWKEFNLFFFFLKELNYPGVMPLETYPNSTI